MHKLYELKEMLCEELEEYGSKDKLDVGGLDIVDKLAHAIKNLDKIIEAYEEEEYSSRGSYEGGSYDNGSSYARNGRSGYSRRGSYESGGSYARGGRGRYSRARGYSRDGDMIMELRELMEEAPDEKTRQEFQRFISKIEGM